ncbi:MAG TPA: hypothetical protein VMX12_02500 [Acidimicrobiia bacterium]|nr:hypothetical protein [Acidimicrobiia bacterium]
MAVKNDWFEALHPGRRAAAEKAEKVPVMTKLAALFDAEYGDQIAAADAAAEKAAA